MNIVLLYLKLNSIIDSTFIKGSLHDAYYPFIITVIYMNTCFENLLRFI